MYVLNSSCQNFFKTYSKFYETAQSLSDITYSLSFPHCLDSKLLVLSRFSHVRFCATPETAAHQVLQSLGFSRQEHWSGLPFPSPCMKVKSESEVTQSCSTLSDPHGLQPTRLLRPWDFPGKSTGEGCHCLLQVKSYSHS